MKGISSSSASASRGRSTINHGENRRIVVAGGSSIIGISANLKTSIFPVATSSSSTTRLYSTDAAKSSSSSSSSDTPAPIPFIVDPQDERHAHYQGNNMAQYLVDLHDSQATFDFCGGMLFQLVLSDKLREHLLVHAISNHSEEEVVSVADASAYRMHRLPSYEQSAQADNIALFHGREIRRVPWAKGGRGFVLHLSLADTGTTTTNNNNHDPEGWTPQEVAGYDGWGHDSGRDWRTGDRLEQEGFTDFRTKFGPDAFALHHRFCFHWDSFDRLWLSAEDGCEGTPADVLDKTSGAKNPIESFFRGLF